MRYEKASPKKLPPTDYSFMCHLKRINGQLLTWKKAIIAMHEVINPADIGYDVNQNGKLLPIMMTKIPATPEL